MGEGGINTGRARVSEGEIYGEWGKETRGRESEGLGRGETGNGEGSDRERRSGRRWDRGSETAIAGVSWDNAPPIPLASCFLYFHYRVRT